MMNVTFVVKQDKHTTGHGRYANSLMKGMEGQAKTNVIHATGKKLPGWAINVGRWFGKDLEFYFEKRPSELTEMPKGEIVHYLNQFITLPLLKGKYRTAADVVTVHDVMQLSGQDQLPSRYIERKFFLDCFKACAKAKRIITTAQCVKDDIAKYLNYPADRIDIIYEGVDHNTFKPRTTGIPEIKYFDKKKTNILYVGNDLKRKNMPRMLQAFAKVKKEIPNAHFLWVGSSVDPEQAVLVKKTVEDLHLEKHVTFVGQVEGMLPYFYNLADLFLFPTLYEGFGLPPLEAMASGCPTIISNQGALPEIAGPKIPAPDPYHVDAIANEVIRILKDDKAREKLVKDGLARAKQFTWEQAAKDTLESYKKVLEQ